MSFEELKNQLDIEYQDKLDNREPEEIFEWWVCDEWMIKKLKEKEQPILTTDYGDWWGRTCTGQAIFLDGVIEEIYDECHN